MMWQPQSAVPPDRGKQRTRGRRRDAGADTPERMKRRGLLADQEISSFGTETP